MSCLHEMAPDEIVFVVSLELKHVNEELWLDCSFFCLRHFPLS